MEQCIVITGGGTGGHVFPALAVAEVLRKTWKGRLVWIGSGKGIEKDIVSRWGMEFRSVPTGKLRRYLSFKNLIDIFKTVGGIFASFAVLSKLKPILVFSKGGFVSVPPVIAAKLLGIPVISHESDFDPGLATRINQRFSRTICVAYEESLAFYPPGKAIVTGNPIRAEIFAGDPIKGRSILGFEQEGKPVLFVQGGSLGARQINQLVIEHFGRLCEHYRIVHQRGNVEPFFEDEPGRYVSRPFFSAEYPHILAVSDVVVSRAGAGSIWEMGLLGKPGMLVPLAAGTRGDQIRNAELCRKKGCCLVFEASPESDTASDGAADATGFIDPLIRLAIDPSARASMSLAWGGLVHRDGAENTARQVMALCSKP